MLTAERTSLARVRGNREISFVEKNVRIDGIVDMTRRLMGRWGARVIKILGGQSSIMGVSFEKNKLKDLIADTLSTDSSITA